MSKIYLHVGMPKTGTSALQKFLLLNRELLETYGYYYPGHELGGNDISSGNGEELFNILEELGTEAAINHLQRLSKKSGNLTLLISSEFFFNIPDQIHAVVPDATIILYFRDPIALLESSYNQSVKRLGQIHSFSRMLNRVLNIKDPFYTGGLALRWLELYGRDNIIFRLYESSSFSGGDLYHDFLHCLGIENSEVFALPQEKVNVSYSPDALEVKRRLNGVLDTSDPTCLKAIDLQLQRISHEYFLSGGKQYSLYSDKELHIAQQFFKPFIQSIADHFGHAFPLFKEGYSLKPDDRSMGELLNENARIATALNEGGPKLRPTFLRAISKAICSDSWIKREAGTRLLPLVADAGGYSSALAEAHQKLAGTLPEPWFDREQLVDMAEGRFGKDDYLTAIETLSAVNDELPDSFDGGNENDSAPGGKGASSYLNFFSRTRLGRFFVKLFPLKVSRLIKEYVGRKNF